MNSKKHKPKNNQKNYNLKVFNDIDKQINEYFSYFDSLPDSEKAKINKQMKHNHRIKVFKHRIHSTFLWLNNYSPLLSLIIAMLSLIVAIAALLNTY